jgi:hypothetical protein
MRLVLAVLLLLPSAGWCQWKVEVEWDEMTDHRSATAYTSSSEGHRLLFWFPQDGSARITINLTRGQFEFVHKEFSKDQFPIYRVDREPPMDLGKLRNELELRSADETAIGWKVADKRLQPPLSLAKVLGGKRLLLRYIDSEGTQHDIVFSLEGADRAYKLAAELQQ